MNYLQLNIKNLKANFGSSLFDPRIYNTGINIITKISILLLTVVHLKFIRKLLSALLYKLKLDLTDHN